MHRRTFLSGALASASLPSLAQADQVADFYRGRTITCYIGYASGGGYDVYARVISRFMQKHLPGNPNIIAVNMPGASSMTLGNHLARVAPRDGTAFGAVNSMLLFDPLFNGAKSKAQFTGVDMTLIGNAVVSAAVLIALKTADVSSLEELRTKELMIAASTPSGDTYMLPLALKNVLGLKLKIITGYPGTREVALALENGEVQGRVWDMEGIKAARPQWLRDGTIRILAQLAPRADRAAPPGVPLARDFAANEDDRKVLDVICLSTALARPYIAPPGLPPERAQALKDAFWATMQDPDFLAEMNRLQLAIDPVSGPDMEKLLKDAYALPDTLVQRVRKALVTEG